MWRRWAAPQSVGRRTYGRWHTATRFDSPEAWAAYGRRGYGHEVGDDMDQSDLYRFEIEDRLLDVPVKKHVSVRWEPGSGICRVGVMLHEYTWERRDEVLARVLAFESAHADDVAVEVDIFPLEAATSVDYAHA